MTENDRNRQSSKSLTNSEWTQLRNRLYDLSKRNSLIHMNDAFLDRCFSLAIEEIEVLLGEKEIIFESVDHKVGKAYLKAKKVEAKSGINQLNLVISTLRWNDASGKVKDVVTSPLLFVPIRLEKIKSIVSKWKVSIESDQIIVNPLLKYYFEHQFNCVLPEVKSIDKIEEFFQEFEGLLKQQDWDLIEGESEKKNSWSFHSTGIIGTFEHRKMVLLKDYDEIIQNDKKAFDFSDSNHKEVGFTELVSSIHPVVEGDHSQFKSVFHALNRNTVIQGPPGTGKSQTIVNIASSALMEGKKVLIVSEKRTALEVLKKKMVSSGIGMWGLLFGSESAKGNKDFIQELKTSFEFLLERSSVKLEPIVAKAPIEYLTLLDAYHSQLTTIDDWHGVGPEELMNELLFKQVEEPEDWSFWPSCQWSQWKRFRHVAIRLEEVLQIQGEISLFARHSFSQLSASLRERVDVGFVIRKELNQLKSTLPILMLQLPSDQKEWKIQELRYLFAAGRLLESLQREGLLFSINKRLNQSKELDTLLLNWKHVNENLLLAQDENQFWIKKPLKAETEMLQKRLMKLQKGFFNQLWRRKEKEEKLINGVYDFSKHLLKPDTEQVIASLLKEYRLEVEGNKIKKELQEKYGIVNPEISIQFIREARLAIAQSENIHLDWILKQKNKESLIRSLSELRKSFEKVDTSLKILFDHSFDWKLEKAVNSVDKLQSQIHQLDSFLGALIEFWNCPIQVRKLIASVQDSVERINIGLAQKCLKNILSNRLLLEKTDGETLENWFQQLDLSLKKWYFENGNVIHQQKAIQFNNLMQQSDRSITSTKDKSEKDFLKRINKGRRTLEREFDKSRSYRSPRQLMEENGKEWLFMLKPIWLANPIQIAETLSLGKMDFDLVIFDESSQILLEHALPVLNRAKKWCVVGDTEQLAPSSYFQSVTKEDELPKSLLDFMKYQTNADWLRYHYRSSEELIAFSNKHFYENRLKAILPAVPLSSPLQFIYLENTVYSEGKNDEEASIVAELVLSQLEQGKTSILVVAMSLEQKKNIELALQVLLKENSRLLDVYQESQEDWGNGLMISNLENIQGDERDEVIVSLGYGEKEGKVSFQMGALNKAGGEKRLNVLITRAREKMIFVSSIRSQDMRWSDNVGVNMLRNLLVHLERNSNKREVRNNESLDPSFLSLVRARLNEVMKCELPSVTGISPDLILENGIGILIEGDSSQEPWIDYYQRRAMLEKQGWKIICVWKMEWIKNKENVIEQIKRRGIELCQ